MRAATLGSLHSRPRLARSRLDVLNRHGLSHRGLVVDANEDLVQDVFQVMNVHYLLLHLCLWSRRALSKHQSKE